MATKNVIEGSNKVSAAQLKDLFRQIDEGGITGDHIQALLERRSLTEGISEIKSINFNDKLYEIEVDGTKTFKELNLKFNFSFNTNYPSFYSFKIMDKTKRRNSIKLFNFDKDLTSFEIIEKMLSENFQPSTLEEILCLLNDQPQLHVQFTIIALGSKTDAMEVPIFYSGGSLIEGIRIYKQKEWDHAFKYRFAGTKI